MIEGKKIVRYEIEPEDFYGGAKNIMFHFDDGTKLKLDTLYSDHEARCIGIDEDSGDYELVYNHESESWNKLRLK